MKLNLALALSLFAVAGIAHADASSITLYEQDFENPVNFAAGGYDDLSQQAVNDLYGNQPAGFAFAQDFTVETLLLTGSAAFGTGYSDPGNKGGNYALGIQSGLGALSNQNDILALSFSADKTSYNYFNFSMDFSSIGISGGFNSPFSVANEIPTLKFSLYDNPSGSSGLTGNGTLLGQVSVNGTGSDLGVLDWTNAQMSFDLGSSTNGSVTLQIDMTAGGYAAMDNFLITASVDPLTPVPLGPSLPLLLTGLVALPLLRRARR